MNVYQYAKRIVSLSWLTSVLIAFIAATLLRIFFFSLYHVPTGSAEPTLLVGDRIWGSKISYSFAPITRGDLVIFDDPEFYYEKKNYFLYFWQRYIRIPIWKIANSSGPESWIKRVVGVPGDIIEGRVERGKTVIYLNGKCLVEPYVNSYPLVRVKKTTGFNISENFIFTSLFPLEVEKEVDYSYDPSCDPTKQPFYYIQHQELVRTVFSKDIILTAPFTPTYVLGPPYSGDIDCVDSFGPIVIPQGKYWVMGDNRKNSRDSRYWGFLDRKLVTGKAIFIIYSIDGEEKFWLFEFIKSPISFFTKKIRWSRFLSGIKNEKRTA